jgi:hypothetical protein
MSKGNPRALPRGITPKTRTKNGKTVPVVTEGGTPVYRVRVWDPVLKKQIERIVEGLDAAKQLLEEFTEAKRRPGRLTAERVRFADVAAATSSPTRPSATVPRAPGHRWPRSGPA